MNYTKIIIFTISIIVSLSSKSQYITGSITELNRNQKPVPFQYSLGRYDGLVSDEKGLSISNPEDYPALVVSLVG